MTDSREGTDRAEGLAIRRRVDRSTEQPGQEVGRASGMAAEATALPAKKEVIGTVEGALKIEDGTDLGIDAGDFDPSIGHPAKVNILVEIEGPGISGMNDIPLQAGLRENENLRRDRNLKLLEKPLHQGFAIRLVYHNFPAVDPVEELGHRVGQFSSPVGVRFQLKIVPELSLERTERGETDQKSQEGAESNHGLQSDSGIS